MEVYNHEYGTKIIVLHRQNINVPSVPALKREQPFSLDCLWALLHSRGNANEGNIKTAPEIGSMFFCFFLIAERTKREKRKATELRK